MFNHIGPFNDRDHGRVTYDFGQFVGQNSCFLEAIKIKVVDLEFICHVDLAYREGRAGYLVLAAGAPRQAAHKCRLAAAQVADQLYYLAALKGRA